MVRSRAVAILHSISIDALRRRRAVRELQRARRQALLGLNRTMALELGQHGIRVNCVSPGFTHTDMTERAVGPKLMDVPERPASTRVPMRRLVAPGRRSRAAFAFLASDDASAITGHRTSTVDCGLTANWFILETLPGE